MKMKNQKLLIEQVDRKLSQFKPLRNTVVPQKGWVHTIRTALKMSLRQFGNRLGIGTSTAQDIEKREQEGTITLKALREAGAALNMQLIYGFVPKDGTLEAMIEQRAEELAREMVKRTNITMSLEDQGTSDGRKQKAIQEKKMEIMYKLPKKLWD